MELLKEKKRKRKEKNMSACTHLTEMLPKGKGVQEKVLVTYMFISLALVLQQMMNNAVSKPGSQQESKRAAKMQMCHEMKNSFFHGS